MSAAESPAATVISPLPTSVRPPALAAKPPTVACMAGLASATVPPAAGTTRLEASAEPLVICSRPPCTVVDPVSVHDLHATILHLLGIDHERLTYRYAGRDFRLTDVHGRVIRDIVA